LNASAQVDALYVNASAQVDALCEEWLKGFDTISAVCGESKIGSKLILAAPARHIRMHIICLLPKSD
jgi:hypothetical protein